MNSIHKTTFTITSLIHLRDYALYTRTQVDTISVHTPEASRTLRQSYRSTGRASFNPHLPIGVGFGHFYRYRLPHSSIPIYKVITLQTVFQRLVVSGSDVVFGLEETTGTWSVVDPRTVEQWSRG